MHSLAPHTRRQLLLVCEPLLLRAVARFLRHLRPEWDIVGVSSEVEARRLVETRGWDLVLAEITPYSTAGVEVLKHARLRQPTLHRVAYWGNFDLEHPEVRRAHTILPCPIGLEEFVGSLDQALRDADAARAA